MNAIVWGVAAYGLVVSWIGGFVWLAVVLAAVTWVGPRRAAARHWLCLVGLIGLWAITIGVWLAPFSSWSLVALDVFPAPQVVEPARSIEPLAVATRRPPANIEMERRPDGNAALAADNRAPAGSARVETLAGSELHSKAPSAAGQPSANVERASRGAAAVWSALVAIVWIGGAVVGAVRLWNAQRAWQRLWGRAVDVEQASVHGVLQGAARQCGLRAVPELRASDEVVTAVVAGVRKARIVVPRQWLGSVGREHWGHALRHECAHVALHHLGWQIVENVTRIVWWPQPLVFALGRHLQSAREDVCDNFVLQFDVAADYAESLLVLAELSPARRGAFAGVPLFGRRARLSGRIESLLDGSRDPRVSAARWWRGAVGSLAAAFLLALVTVRWQARAVEPAADGQTVKQSAAERQGVGEKGEKPAGAAGQIRGTIAHADGQPAAGVEVRLIPSPKDHYTLPLKPWRVRSDAQGKFVFDGLKPGSYRAYAFAGNETTRSRSFKFANAVVGKDGRQEKPLELVLKPGVKLVARVTSAETGQPLSDAVLDSRWTDTDDGFHANEQGVIEVPILTDERWHIEIAAPGHARYTSDLKLNAPETTIDVALQPGGEVAGRVLDEDGQPLARARVEVHVERSSMYRLDTATTNDAGEYHLRYVPLNTPLAISASRDGYNYASRNTSVSSQQLVRQADLQLVPLANGGTVSGRVVDEAGKPIAGAQLVNGGNSSSDERKATSDAAGKFKIEKLYVQGGDRVLVTIRAKGFAPTQVELSREQREGTEPLDVTLAPGHRIRGRVVNEDGRPLKARVYYAEGEHSTHGIGGRIDTDAEGRFEFDSLPPDCTFTVSAADHSELDDQSLPLDGDADVVVRLEPIGVIRGQVIDAATKKPVERFNVRIAFPAHSEPGDKKIGGISSTRIEAGEDFTPADGRFELGSLKNDCVFDVIVAAEGYRRETVSRMTATPSKQAETATIALEPIERGDLVTVAGRVVGEDGQPAAGVQVRLLGFEGGGGEPPFTWVALETDSLASNSNYAAYLRTVTNERGEFSLENVPGWLSLRLAYWSETVPATRVDGLEQRPRDELAKLTLTHERPVTVRVLVDREAYPDAGSITVMGDDFQHTAHRDHELEAGDRSYTFTGLQTGRLNVYLYGRRIATGETGTFTRKSLARRTLDVKAGETIEVNFEGE